MSSNKFVGAHCSASGGVFNAVTNAQKIGLKHLLFLQRIKDSGLPKI